MALNSIQREILDGLLTVISDSCEELKPEDKLMVFRSIICQKIEFNVEEILKKLDIWGLVKQNREILAHPCPQNRNIGDPSAASGSENGVIENEAYYWVGGFGKQLKHEPQGLLGLTAKNDEETSPVTKSDVTNYIKHFCYYNIHKYKSKLGLSAWDYFSVPASPKMYGNDREHCYLRFMNRTIKIETKSNHSKKSNTFYQPGFANMSIITATITNQDDIKSIRENLIKDKPNIKRMSRNDSFFSIHIISLDEEGKFALAFWGKDPAMGSLLDILNKYIFDNKTPLYLLNQLKDVVGVELSEYQDDIDYEENTEIAHENANNNNEKSSNKSEITFKL